MKPTIIMTYKSVVLFCVWCLCYADSEIVKESTSNGYPGESLGNIMDRNWKLPEDGGGGDSQCSQDIRRMYNSLNNMTLWAFQMWEATAGGTNGWAQGSVYQLGNFDECLGADDPGMERQYCLATVNITQHPGHPAIHNYVEKFGPYQSIYDIIYYTGDPSFLRRDILYWGICSPASCAHKELEDMLQKHIDENLTEKAMRSNKTNPSIIPDVKLTIPEDVCQVKEEREPYTIGALFFFWLVGLSSLAVLVASIFHYYLIYRESDPEVDCPRIVKIYSAIGNFKSLKSREHGGESNGMECLWGIRFISIFFIICGHRFGTTMASAVFNRNNVEEEYHSFTSMLICHGDVVVDSFFVLSGLLSIYGILKNTKDKSMINYPLMILYRYIRLAPGYAIVILFTGFVLPLTGSGPTWPAVLEHEALFCRENWWLNLLMLNNYIGVGRMCMAHTWYIPCDFHFFLLSLAICTLFKMKSRAFTALSVLSILIVVAMLIPAIITYTMRLPGVMLFFNEFLTNPRNHKYFQYMYIPSHTRAAPHLIGILTGYFIYKYNTPARKPFSTVLSSIGGFVALGILIGVMASGTIFYEPNHPYSVLEATFYAALQRSVWAVGVCAIIICCVFGNIPFISSILGWSPWVPLGKLVYGAYLSHMGLQIRSASLNRIPLYVDKLTIFGQAFGDAVVAFVGSLILYLLFEAPVRNIVGLLLRAKIELPRKHSAAQDSYSPTAADNRALELDGVEAGEMKNNFTKMETFGKIDNSFIKEDNYNVNNYKL